MREFKSAGEFVRHLKEAKRTAHHKVTLGLRDAGRLVQEEARGFIGHYQGAAGPFPEWPALAESTLAGGHDIFGREHPGKVELGYAPPDNPLLREGHLRNAIELSYDAVRAVVGVPDEQAGSGAPHDPVRNIGDVAVDHEFGTKNMPARSFLGRALFVCAEEVAEIIGHAVMQAVMGKPYTTPPKKQHLDDIPF